MCAPVAAEDLCEYSACPILEELTSRLEPLLFLHNSLWVMVGVILDYVGVWGLHYYFSQPEKYDIKYEAHSTAALSTRALKRIGGRNEQQQGGGQGYCSG